MMDQSTSFSQSRAALPPPPPLAQTDVIGSMGDFSASYAPGSNATAFSGYLPEAIHYGTGFGLNAAIPEEYKLAINARDGEAMAFNLSGINGHVSQQSVGFSQPFSFAANGYHAVSQEPMQTSPIAVSQTSAGLISPKRVAESLNGIYGHQRQGSSKRQRLDLAINTELSTSRSSQYSQQPNQFQAATSQRSSAMNSVDYGSGDGPMSANPVDRSRSNSHAVSGNLPPVQTPWTTQLHTQTFAHGQGYGGPSSVSNMPPGYDSQRPGAFTMPPQNTHSATARYDHRLASSLGINVLTHGAGEHMTAFHPNRQPLDLTMATPKQSSDGRFLLVMKQQPERARLCSFKEENDTSKHSSSCAETALIPLCSMQVDRRPVDPPPIVQIIPTGGDSIR
jgi:hypothetical protein